MAALRALRREVIDPAIAAHQGRIVKTTGDGMLVEFHSVLDALRCAAAVQCEMTGRNADVAAGRQIEFRIGIHQGDIVVEDGDIFGDGVNIAARLEGIAEPGGICVSSRVQEDAVGRLDLAFENLGEQALKNIARPVRVYRVEMGPPASGRHAGGPVRSAALARQAVDRGLAVSEPVGRPGAGVFRRRHGRGDHHGAVAHPLAVRDRSQFELYVQGAGY
ncbi:MAG: adenylate/guanylate cyclase domain-containing protein [Alphaproteobacteria bacterium]